MKKVSEGMKDAKVFFKYAIYIPAILTIFLEMLQFTKNIDISWFWILSPLWIWVGGAFQFLLGGMLTEALEKKK